ncbi:MAG: flgB [Phenylobacterium sp.]|nr:flgB [Phenylobacterium sp.]
MDLSQIPLFAMLRGRLGYLSERQQLIAGNVANADTPGFQPKDLKPFSFDAQMQALQTPDGAAAGPAVTQPGHMSLAQGASGSRSKFRPATARDSETRLDGNSVVLEEEMMKMSDARMNYDAAISFYQKSLGLLRMAARAPGK